MALFDPHPVVTGNPVSRFLFGSDEAPEYGGREMGADQQNQMYAEQDARTFKKEDALKGVDENLYNAVDVGDIPGGGQSFSRAALNARSKRLFGDALAEQRSNAEIAQVEEQQRQRAENMDTVRQIQRMAKHVSQRRMQATMNQIAARGRVVGRILGTAGAVAGGIMGGPLGASAGSQVGGGMRAQGGGMGPSLRDSSSGLDNRYAPTTYNGSSLNDTMTA